MAGFAPETEVYLFERTGVDRQNQPFFTSEAEKIAWYTSHTYHRFQEYSYQRENREAIRVEKEAELLRNCDMLAFRNNPSYGNWIFCRIEEIEFVNPNTTEIRYTVDYMQTYIEDITFGQCFVEREHVVGDWAGSDPNFGWLQPEGLETGRLMRTRLATQSDDTEITDFALVILSAYDIAGEPTYKVESSNNYPSGLNQIAFDIPKNGRITGLENMLEAYETKGIDLKSAIAGVFVVPVDYLTGTVEKTYTLPNPWPNVDGYTCLNAKCFSSEFFKLEISNRRGNEQELAPEMFSETGNIILRYKSAFAQGSGGAILYPANYGGNPMDFGVIRFDDVQAPFVTDAFASWLSGNMTNVASSVVSDVITGASQGASVGGPQGTLVGGLAGAALSFAKLYDRSKDPAAIGGQVAGHTLEIVLNNYGFSINWLHPYAVNMQCIDEFFSKYGYKINEIKIPNVNTRPKWNFVKTSGAICRGPFSKKAQLEMQENMDNGVTFWHLSPGENISDDWDFAVNKE